MDAIKLDKGTRYRVTKPGARLTGWKHAGPYTQQGCSLQLEVGDEIEYLGMRYSGGSDGIDVEAFRLVSREHPNTAYASEFRPTANPRSIWTTRPDPSFLERVA